MSIIATIEDLEAIYGEPNRSGERCFRSFTRLSQQRGNRL
jgi:hypothetical protein